MGWRRYVVAAIAAVGITSCSGSESGVQVSGDAIALSETRLEVILGCYESVRVEVDETPQEVTVQGFGEDPIGGDCASMAIVELEDPLGERDVIDAETGRVVEVVGTDQ